ncbi:nnp-1 protein putative nuclear protein 1 nop52 [Anaeramoeba flamelloides]|uniref:Nnp-1 protein putative nuclear protein 1 nop52 n=1 Tax=Anaeramoeba flamelloides TaxID=1746091 RepID=A0ABQ8X046_9EUKA|nr:nnp-1 protein putative nuclear protein 1 nop52 [Anaeramoeba flamelloides]
MTVYVSNWLSVTLGKKCTPTSPLNLSISLCQALNEIIPDPIKEITDNKETNYHHFQEKCYEYFPLTKRHLKIPPVKLALETKSHKPLARFLFSLTKELRLVEGIKSNFKQCWHRSPNYQTIAALTKEKKHNLITCVTKAFVSGKCTFDSQVIDHNTLTGPATLYLSSQRLDVLLSSKVKFTLKVCDTTGLSVHRRDPRHVRFAFLTHDAVVFRFKDPFCCFFFSSLVRMFKRYPHKKYESHYPINGSVIGRDKEYSALVLRTLTQQYSRFPLMRQTIVNNEIQQISVVLYLHSNGITIVDEQECETDEFEFDETDLHLFNKKKHAKSRKMNTINNSNNNNNSSNKSGNKINKEIKNIQSPTDLKGQPLFPNTIEPIANWKLHDIECERDIDNFAIVHLRIYEKDLKIEELSNDDFSEWKPLQKHQKKKKKLKKISKKKKKNHLLSVWRMAAEHRDTIELLIKCVSSFRKKYKTNLFNKESEENNDLNDNNNNNLNLNISNQSHLNKSNNNSNLFNLNNSNPNNSINTNLINNSNKASNYNKSNYNSKINWLPEKKENSKLLFMSPIGTLSLQNPQLWDLYKNSNKNNFNKQDSNLMHIVSTFSKDGSARIFQRSPIINFKNENINWMFEPNYYNFTIGNFRSKINNYFDQEKIQFQIQIISSIGRALNEFNWQNGKIILEQSSFKIFEGEVRLCEIEYNKNIQIIVHPLIDTLFLFIIKNKGSLIVNAKDSVDRDLIVNCFVNFSLKHLGFLIQDRGLIINLNSTNQKKKTNKRKANKKKIDIEENIGLKFPKTIFKNPKDDKQKLNDDEGGGGGGENKIKLNFEKEEKEEQSIFNLNEFLIEIPNVLPKSIYNYEIQNQKKIKNALNNKKELIKSLNVKTNKDTQKGSFKIINNQFKNYKHYLNKKSKHFAFIYDSFWNCKGEIQINLSNKYFSIKFNEIKLKRIYNNYLNLFLSNDKIFGKLNIDEFTSLFISFKSKENVYSLLFDLQTRLNNNLNENYLISIKYECNLITNKEKTRSIVILKPGCFSLQTKYGSFSTEYCSKFRIKNYKKLTNSLIIKIQNGKQFLINFELQNDYNSFFANFKKFSKFYLTNRIIDQNVCNEINYTNFKNQQIVSNNSQIKKSTHFFALTYYNAQFIGIRNITLSEDGLEIIDPDDSLSANVLGIEGADLMIDNNHFYNKSPNDSQIANDNVDLDLDNNKEKNNKINNDRDNNGGKKNIINIGFLNGKIITLIVRSNQVTQRFSQLFSKLLLNLKDSPILLPNTFSVRFGNSKKSKLKQRVSIIITRQYLQINKSFEGSKDKSYSQATTTIPLNKINLKFYKKKNTKLMIETINKGSGSKNDNNMNNFLIQFKSNSASTKFLGKFFEYSENIDNNIKLMKYVTNPFFFPTFYHNSRSSLKLPIAPIGLIGISGDIMRIHLDLLEPEKFFEYSFLKGIKASESKKDANKIILQLSLKIIYQISFKGRAQKEEFLFLIQEKQGTTPQKNNLFNKPKKKNKEQKKQQKDNKIIKKNVKKRKGNGMATEKGKEMIKGGRMTERNEKGEGNEIGKGDRNEKNDEQIIKNENDNKFKYTFGQVMKYSIQLYYPQQKNWKNSLITFSEKEFKIQSGNRNWKTNFNLIKIISNPQNKKTLIKIELIEFKQTFFINFLNEKMKNEFLLCQKQIRYYFLNKKGNEDKDENEDVGNEDESENVGNGNVGKNVDDEDEDEDDDEDEGEEGEITKKCEEKEIHFDILLLSKNRQKQQTGKLNFSFVNLTLIVNIKNKIKFKAKLGPKLKLFEHKSNNTMLRLNYNKNEQVADLLFTSNSELNRLKSNFYEQYEKNTQFFNLIIFDSNDKNNNNRDEEQAEMICDHEGLSIFFVEKEKELFIEYKNIQIKLREGFDQELDLICNKNRIGFRFNSIDEKSQFVKFIKSKM